MQCWLKFALLFVIGLASQNAEAAGHRVLKVLPHYLDAEGRNALSPSLYERDAYQEYLRQNPEKRAALRFDVRLKLRGKIPLRLKIEARGKGDAGKVTVIERTVAPRGWFAQWTHVKVDGRDFKTLGELVAWRVTLWDGSTQVAEQKSFLW